MLGERSAQPIQCAVQVRATVANGRLIVVFDVGARFKLQACIAKLSELGFAWHVAEKAARCSGADADLAAQLLLDGVAA